MRSIHERDNPRKKKLKPSCHCHPFASAAAPERTRSHYAAILALLRERGPRGVLSSELYDAPHLYGRSPRNRISECRRDGHVIEGKAWGACDWHYVLIREIESPTKRPAPGKPAGQIKLTDSPDWYEREHGPRPGARPAEIASAKFELVP